MPFAAVRLSMPAIPRLERRHWIALVALALLLAAGATALVMRWDSQAPAAPAAAGVGEPGAPGSAPPTPEPLQFQQIAPEDAVAINAAIPTSTLPNPAARPFSMATASEVDRARALDCLTATVYYEAAVEPLDGQRAVAQVVLNRARHPAYPSTVCGVVYQGAERRTGCQFTFTCDGSLTRVPSTAGWARARAVAEAALNGYVHAPVGWATHYHANYVVPYWSSSLVKLGTVGAHIFYRWSGGWGTARAFRTSYAGNEPDIMAIDDIMAEPQMALDAEAQAAEAAAALAAAEATAAAGEPGQVRSFASAVLRPGQVQTPANPAPAPATPAARPRRAGATPATATPPTATPAAPAPAPVAYRSALLRQARQPAAPARTETASAATPAPAPNQ